MDRRNLLLGSVAVLLTGCVPVPYDAYYYVPSASGGEVWRFWRDDIAANITFQDSVLKLEFKVRGAPGRRAAYEFTIARVAPESGPVDAAFETGHMTLSTANGERFDIPLTTADGSLLRFHLVTLDKTEVSSQTAWSLPGGVEITEIIHRNDGTQTPSVEYWLGCWYERDPGDTFDLALPPLTYNGTRFVIPPIHFVRRSVHHSFTGIN